MLGVGRATEKKLSSVGIRTIGQIAQYPCDYFQRKLGKCGVDLWRFANGMDDSQVTVRDYEAPDKSVGHGMTAIQDLENDAEVWHDMQYPKYRRWVCKKCNEHPIKDDDFYKKVTGILNAVIDHPELLDEVEPKDTYESEYEVTSKANQVNHMLTSPGVNFESAFEDILNLASLKYDNCEYDITEELTETIKEDYIGRQRLDDVDTELIERTVSHLTVNNQGKIAIHFINGATVKTEGET